MGKEEKSQRNYGLNWVNCNYIIHLRQGFLAPKTVCLENFLAEKTVVGARHKRPCFKDTPTHRTFPFWDFPAGLVGNSAGQGCAQLAAHGFAYGCAQIGAHGFAYGCAQIGAHGFA